MDKAIFLAEECRNSTPDMSIQRKMVSHTQADPLREHHLPSGSSELLANILSNRMEVQKHSCMRLIYNLVAGTTT